MHDAHPYLSENLPVPVVNPGPLTYKLAEAMLSLGLSHSPRAYRRPDVPKPEMVRAMVAAAASTEA
jgi:allantoin racemase